MYIATYFLLQRYHMLISLHAQHVQIPSNPPCAVKLTSQKRKGTKQKKIQRNEKIRAAPP